jgi:tetratricopeptide (TPR) repeat protein
MTQHETTFLYYIRLRACTVSLLFFIISLAALLWVPDALCITSIEQFVIPKDSTRNLEYLNKTLESAYQAALDKGLKNYDAYAYVLIKECYKALDNNDFAAASILSEYAEKLSPDLPAVAKVQAQARWSRNKFHVYHLIAGYGKGFLKELKHLESLSAFLASIVFSLVGAFFITFVFYSISAAIRYMPLVYHDLSHLLPAAVPRSACSGWALIVFLLPLFFRVSIFWVLCYWLLLFIAYQNKKEHAVTIVFFILLSFIPWLLSFGSSALVAPQIPLVNALWKTNYENWGEREAEYLKVYTQAHPEDAEAVFSLGLIHKKNRDYQSAEFYYQKTLEIKPGYYNVHVNLGNIFCATKKLDQAITEYKKAISLEPSRCTAHLNLSRTYLQKFMFAESEAEFMKARKLDKSLVENFLATYTEHPNRMVIDEPLARQTILDKAFSLPYEHRILSEQLWDFLFRGVPFSSGWAAAVALIIGSLMLLKNNQFQYAKSCVTCGKSFCKKCQRITAQGSSCRQCMNILENRECFDPSLREEKLIEIKQHMRWQTAVTRFFTMAFPGAGLLWKGYLVTGLLCLFCFTFCLFKLLTSALLIQPLWDFIISIRYISSLVFLALLIVLGCILIKYTAGLIISNPYKTIRMHTINRNTAI